MERHLCIHLHFYQPPRENPWLDKIEHQDSAYPFHDWNEKINFECYRSNGQSRILDSDGRVVDLANNYAKTSFNFGPTLLSWMEDKDPVTYERILEGDRESIKNFSGHGSAIAQAYNHLIMPLADTRDKETQVIWGLRDFEQRFKRPAESMWLPETAVDIASLEILSDHGMKYVILAPRQAKAVRSLDHDEPWRDMSGERIDPKIPYLLNLPSGRSIVAFFYDGPISKAVAFEGLLHNGETFANRLLHGFDTSRSSPQLLHIATDGETYGHHHLQGDMALAYAIWHLENNKLATITNYGEYLHKHPPKFEAQIYENSSWSCTHGIERWRSDCGCNSGANPGWHQRWRKPLREALEKLKGTVKEPFEKSMKALGADPWAARNDYIQVINDRSLANVEEFISRCCGGRELNDDEKTQILKMLEAQRHLLLMFTSCAWFFDEISGIESVQNLQYAFRAIELAESSLGLSLLEDFMAILETAESNIADLQNGRMVFEKFVLPSKVDALRVGGHFAVASVFESFGEMNEVYNNKITLEEFKRFEAGRAKMACGRARIRSRVTLERHNMTFGVIHLGDHNVNAGIRFYDNEDNYQKLLLEAKKAFERADFPQVIRVFDRNFGANHYSLKNLFKDEQHKLIDLIMSETMQDVEERFGRIYKNNYPLLCYISDLNSPLPPVFVQIAEFVQKRGIRKTLISEDRISSDVLRKYFKEAKSWGISLDDSGLARTMEQVLESKMINFEKDDENMEKLDELFELIQLNREAPFKVNLGTVQNWFLLWYKERASKKRIPATTVGKKWHDRVWKMGQELRVKLPEENENISGDIPAPVAKELSIQ